MSRVIKNNDGVAVVEGTPAASLVKDVDKFFATKPPERMAGETVAPKSIKDFMVSEKLVSRPAPGSTIPLGPDDRPMDSPIKPKIVPGLNDAPVEEWPWGREDDPNYEKKKKEFFENIDDPSPKPTPFTSEEKQVQSKNNISSDSNARLAVKKAQNFRRQRSSLEAERSQREQEATKGKFITTLGR